MTKYVPGPVPGGRTTLTEPLLEAPGCSAGTDRDPIANFGKLLLQQNLADAAALEQIQSELELQMKKAVEFAAAAPYPAVSEVDEDVYA